MSNRPAAGLAILWIVAALALLPGSANAVLCVGDDGHVAIEATRDGRVCIDQETPRGDEARAAQLAAPQGCVDTPLMALTIATAKLSLGVSPAWTALAVQTLPTAAPLRLRRESGRAHGSPHQAAMLRSVVLRI